ncbi:hypothetical protein B0H14DRAFT_3479297 [Mycena olivaceomarginata]|nr:hypothetical protein B0H14DRAFT_3479297 [Mycena olivaceomarginata]
MVKDIKKRTRSTTTSSINVRTRQIIHQDRVRPHRTSREHELNDVTFDARLYPRRPRRAPTPGPLADRPFGADREKEGECSTAGINTTIVAKLRELIHSVRRHRKLQLASAVPASDAGIGALKSTPAESHIIPASIFPAILHSAAEPPRRSRLSARLLLILAFYHRRRSKHPRHDHHRLCLPSSSGGVLRSRAGSHRRGLRPHLGQQDLDCAAPQYQHQHRPHPHSDCSSLLFLSSSLTRPFALDPPAPARALNTEKEEVQEHLISSRLVFQTDTRPQHHPTTPHAPTCHTHPGRYPRGPPALAHIVTVSACTTWQQGLGRTALQYDPHPHPRPHTRARTRTQTPLLFSSSPPFLCPSGVTCVPFPRPTPPRRRASRHGDTGAAGDTLAQVPPHRLPLRKSTGEELGSVVGRPPPPPRLRLLPLPLLMLPLLPLR